MKNKKILSSILVLALVFGLGLFVQAEVQIDTYNGLSDFEDMDPVLEHPAVPGEKFVDTVISCNMYLKPKTQIDLSRLCSSAITRLKYYFNGSSSSVQEGSDYNNTVKREIFYPASRRISNSYLGGTISYQVASEFQTKKSTGDKINLVTPMEGDTGVYKTAVIISSKVVHIEDMGVEYILSQPTGDQSQPNWIGVMKGYPALSGRSSNWTFRFGTLDESTSGVFGLFKSQVQSKRALIIKEVNGMDFEFPIDVAEDMGLPVIDGVIYLESTQGTSLNAEKMELCKKAKRLVMEYNLDPNACDGAGNILTEDGWKAIDANQAKLLKVNEEENKLYYPEFMNAWGRIYAVMTEPSDNDYRPAKRARIKSRIGTYGGFKFNNLVDGDVVKIYNVNGQKVAELTAGETSEGFEWKGRKGTNNSGDWAKSGIYIYQIKLKEKSKIISGTIVFAY